jgi:hypothetical protein
VKLAWIEQYARFENLTSYVAGPDDAYGFDDPGMGADFDTGAGLGQLGDGDGESLSPF